MPKRRAVLADEGEEGGDESAGEGSAGRGTPAKATRVTTACDRCTKRRRRCVKAEGSDACILCTSLGKADECVYSKPVRRRGPVAGYAALAKSLQHLLGEMLFVAPQTNELALYCLNQRSSCALLPNPPLVRPTRDTALETYNAIVAPFLSAPEKPSPADALEESAPHRLLELVGLPANQPESAGSGDFSAQHADAQQVHSSETQWAPQDTLSSFPSPPSASPSFRSPMARLLGDVAASERTRATQLSTALPPLPPQDVMDSLLDIYFSGPAHLSFPILDRDAILSTSIPVASSSTASASKLEASQHLEALWAVLATAATQAPGVLPDALSPDVVRAYAHTALSAAVGRPALETVQAAVLLVSVDLHVGDVFAASAHFGMALFLALALGLQDTSAAIYATADERTRQLCLRTMWGLLVLDLQCALRLGRAPMLRLSSSTLPLPSTVGLEEVELVRPVAPQEIERRLRIDGLSVSNASGSRVSRACSLSTFVALVELCALGGDLLLALSTPGSSVSACLEALSVWERDLPATVRASATPGGQAHKHNLHLLQRSLLILGTTAGSSATSALPLGPLVLDAQAHLHLLYTSGALLHARALHLDIVAILASVTLTPSGLDPSDSSALHDLLIAALAHLAHLSPLASELLLALQSRSLPSPFVPPQAAPLMDRGDEPPLPALSLPIAIPPGLQTQLSPPLANKPSSLPLGAAPALSTAPPLATADDDVFASLDLANWDTSEAVYRALGLRPPAPVELPTLPIENSVGARMSGAVAGPEAGPSAANPPVPLDWVSHWSAQLSGIDNIGSVDWDFLNL